MSGSISSKKASRSRRLKGVVGPLHQLHVLPRHRLTSIASRLGADNSALAPPKPPATDEEEKARTARSRPRSLPHSAGIASVPESAQSGCLLAGGRMPVPTRNQGSCFRAITPRTVPSLAVPAWPRCESVPAECCVSSTAAQLSRSVASIASRDRRLLVASRGDSDPSGRVSLARKAGVVGRRSRRLMRAEWKRRAMYSGSGSRPTPSAPHGPGAGRLDAPSGRRPTPPR